MSVRKLQFVELKSADAQRQDHIAPADIREAYLRGVKDGQTVMQEQVDVLTQHVSASLKQRYDAWETAKREWTYAAEREMFRAACEIVQKVLSAEAVSNPLLLHASVRRAVQQIADSTGIRAIVPAEHLSAWKKVFDGTAVAVIGDPDLRPGEVSIQSEIGCADLGVAAQISEVQAVLLQEQPSASRSLQ